jgi:hypothetical protein
MELSLKSWIQIILVVVSIFSRYWLKSIIRIFLMDNLVLQLLDYMQHPLWP